MRETNRMADVDKPKGDDDERRPPPPRSAGPIPPMPPRKAAPDRQEAPKPKGAINISPQTPAGRPPPGRHRRVEVPQHISRHADRKED